MWTMLFWSLWFAIWVGGMIAVIEELGAQPRVVLIAIILIAVGPPVFVAAMVWEIACRVYRWMNNTERQG